MQKLRAVLESVVTIVGHIVFAFLLIVIPSTGLLAVSAQTIQAAEFRHPIAPMSALIGIERHLIGIEQLSPVQWARLDRAPAGGDGKLDIADLIYAERRVLGGADYIAAEIPLPESATQIQRNHQYSWHGEPGHSVIASHTEWLIAGQNAGNNAAEEAGQPGTIASREHFYDAAGRLVRAVNEAGHQTLFSDFGPTGLPGRIVDANGVQTSLSYHPRGWLLGSTVHDPENPDAATDAHSAYEYDAAGRLQRAIFPSGRWLEYQYDARGKLLSLRDSGGQQANYAYDVAGNPVMQSLCKYDSSTGQCPQSFSFSMYYDGLGRLRRSVDGRGAAHSINYNDNNQPVEQLDARQNRQLSGYNAFGELANLSGGAASPSSDAPVEFSYRDDGALESLLDASGYSTDFQRDAFGNVTARRSAAGGEVRYSYDAAGNRTSSVDAEGRQQIYRYDNYSRLLRVHSIGDPDAEINFIYDSPEDDGYPVGRVSARSDASGSEQYRYDHRGNLLHREIDIESMAYALAMQYNLDDQLMGIDYPEGSQLRYTRNESGQISSISLDGEEIIGSVEYLPFGPVSAYQRSNGVSLVQQHNPAYRLGASFDSGPMFNATRNYSYDPAGNLETLESTGEENVVQTFTYDASHRLVQALGPAESRAYTYSSNGDRLSREIREFRDTEELVLEQQDYAYDQEYGRLLQVNRAGSSDTSEVFHYDLSGRVVQIDRGDAGAGSLQSENYLYDSLGRLDTVRSASGERVEYQYNADEQRVSRAVYDALAGDSAAPRELWHFIYGSSGELLARYDRIGNRAVLYIYLDDLRVARVLVDGPQKKLEFYHNDNMGRPWALSDAGGQRVWEAQYTPFGERTVVLANTEPQLHGLPGQLFDSHTGLWYNHHRDYSAQLGRYLQSDPLGPQGGLNTYLYSGANPLRFSDPQGLFFFGPVCGSGASARFVPDGPFTQACRKHDECYENCNKSKEQCDLELCTDGACLYGFMLSTVFDGASGDAYDNAQKGCEDCEQGG